MTLGINCLIAINVLIKRRNCITKIVIARNINAASRLYNIVYLLPIFNLLIGQYIL